MLGAQEIQRLLDPYLKGTPCAQVDESLFEQLSVYLELILKWNAKTNLTAIRTSTGIVQRHFGESLFAGLQLAEETGEGTTLLDFGSGAGFPGVPIQLLRPKLKVTLSESQGKKASFLREVVRTLGLSSEVWADRVEDMPRHRLFDVVVMRAVDTMDLAILEARRRASRELVLLGTDSLVDLVDTCCGLDEVKRVGLPASISGAFWKIAKNKE